MSDGGTRAFGYGGAAVVAMLIPLAIAFAHDVRSEIKATRSELVEELRLTRATLTHGVTALQMRLHDLETRVTRVETMLSLEKEHGDR